MKIKLLATRSSCFAIISAIETDIREFITFMAINSAVNDILPSDVRIVAQRRYKLDKQLTEDPQANSDLDLLGYTDFADLAKILNRYPDKINNCTKDKICALSTRLITHTPARNRVCHSRPLEPEDFSTLVDFSEHLLSEYNSLPFSRLKTIMSQLREAPSALLGITIPSYWDNEVSRISHNLPMPDFEETGFLGRSKDRRQLLLHLRSPHPVVSVVGEGGVGKTALVLRCLYDLLEEDNEPIFDSIVWTTSKTKALTTAGVASIRDAVISTLGVFQTVASVMTVPDSTNQQNQILLLDEIKQFMETFKVLVVIDNFETLAESQFRDFLANTPRGSKVLITSRLGLGEIELRYTLDVLDRATAIDLVRKHAASLNLSTLRNADITVIDRFCKALHDNPLLIKWFVSSVSLGALPDSVLRKETSDFKTALKFCFENLFDRLSDADKKVIHILASARRPLTSAEIQFIATGLSDIDGNVIDIEAAMLSLLRSSIIRRLSEKGTNAFLHSLTETASEYVAIVKPPTRTFFQEVQRILRRLTQLVQTENLKRAAYIYDVCALKPKSRDDIIAAIYLKKALQLKKHTVEEIAEAKNLIRLAKQMSPTYSEVYRISAVIEADTDNPYQATEEYINAIDLEPNSPLIRYAYARFLLNNIEDFPAALDQVDTALKLDSDARPLLSLRANILSRLGKYSESASIFESLLADTSDIERKWRLPMICQSASNYKKWAEQDLSFSESEQFVDHIEKACDLLENTLCKNEFDEKAVDLYSKCIDSMLLYALHKQDLSFIEGTINRARECCRLSKVRRLYVTAYERLRSEFTSNTGLVDRLSIFYGPDIAAKSDNHISGSRRFVERVGQGKLFGVIRTIVDNYGFITGDDKRDWFFHKCEVANQNCWQTLCPTMRVSFNVGKNSSGPCAVDVSVSNTI